MMIREMILELEVSRRSDKIGRVMTHLASLLKIKKSQNYRISANFYLIPLKDTFLKSASQDVSKEYNHDQCVLPGASFPGIPGISRFSNSRESREPDNGNFSLPGIPGISGVPLIPGNPVRTETQFWPTSAFSAGFSSIWPESACLV